MGIWLALAVLLIGIVMTVKGGDLFVDAAIWMAERTGISSGIIGATVVSVATTLPEFFVSTVASKDGFSDMAIGNALGSYICNIAFVIGICALIKPIKVQSSFFGIKGVMMMSYLCIFFILSKDGIITYNQGYFLLSLAVFFLIINVIEYKMGNTTEERPTKTPLKLKELLLNGFKFAIGGFLIIYGANLLVDSGVEIANVLRIPKQVISLTLLAIGTSIPELVTALTATIKGEHSMSLGNILGANILNISVIMGGSSLVSEQGLIVSKQTLILDIPIAIIVSLIFLVSGIYGEKISRFTGGSLLAIYIGYLLILF